MGREKMSFPVLPALPVLPFPPYAELAAGFAHYSPTVCLPIPPDVPSPEGLMSQLRSKFVWTGIVLSVRLYRSLL